MRVGSLAGPARVVGAACVRPFVWVARARGWRWCALVAAECLVAAACGAVLWWSTSLRGLPDVGDPFDVAAFRAERVAPADNAYTLFAYALTLYQPAEKWDAVNGKLLTLGELPRDDPVMREWLRDNRAALDTFLRGADRPDAMRRRSDPSAPGLVHGWALRELVELALADARRREARGDAAGAWRCYRGIFRAARLVARHGASSERTAGAFYHDQAYRRLIAWVDKPATSPALLRTALDDLLALEALAPDEAYTLKADYLEAIQTLDQEGFWRQGAAHTPSWRVGDFEVPKEWMETIYQGRRFLAREPERSKRVIRLLTAQGLSYFATPPARRPKPALKLVLRYGTGGRLSTDLFPPGPGTPALPPEALARWALSTLDAREGLLWGVSQFTQHQDRELRGQRRVVYLVAEALYRRDHGQPPPTDAALVGTYLKRLPDGPDTTDDGTTPTLEVTFDPR